MTGSRVTADALLPASRSLCINPQHNPVNCQALNAATLSDSVAPWASLKVDNCEGSSLAMSQHRVAAEEGHYFVHLRELRKKQGRHLISQHGLQDVLAAGDSPVRPADHVPKARMSDTAHLARRIGVMFSLLVAM